MKQRCSAPGCTQHAIRLCDWKVPTRKSGTCDKPMCAFHAYQPRGYDDRDLCPEHKAAWLQHPKGKGSAD